MILLVFPCLLVTLLALWWFPSFFWKNDPARRNWFGKFLFWVNGPLYYFLIGPSFFPQPPLQFRFLTWPGYILAIYGLVVTLLTLKPKIKAGGAGYEPTQLITHGIFSHLRHPQLAGAFYISLGFSLSQNALYHLYLSFIYLAIFAIHVWMEEKYLLIPLFGDEYLAYRKKTKAFFFGIL